MTSVTIISDIPHDRRSGGGWAPILHMQSLLADLIGADLHDVSSARSNRIQSVIYPHYTRRRSTEDRVAIYITYTGYGARKFIPAAEKLGGFSRTVIWIIDSFWTDSVKRERRLIEKHFDLVAYMQAFDDDFYRGMFGERAVRLSWGSDVLALGSSGAERNIDLLRIGRQPANWDDDDETGRACAVRGLRFAGRPPMASASENSTSILMRDYYSHTKFLLAHSNVAAPASYTHPTKAYITGRWTDALACGAVVAGVPPEGDLDLLDWPEALLPFPNLNREEGLDLIAAKAASWTPEVARRNHLGALRNLDWRWSFRKLLNTLMISSPRLDQEISNWKAE